MSGSVASANTQAVAPWGVRVCITASTAVANPMR